MDVEHYFSDGMPVAGKLSVGDAADVYTEKCPICIPAGIENRATR
jgi:hypothetical protein